MTTDEVVRELWDQNADNWAELNQQGYNVYRDLVSNPAFFSILPPVSGLNCLDIGCGEGDGTRKLAELNASVTGIDISPKMIAHAKKASRESSPSIHFISCSVVDMPFESHTFDVVTAFCSLMDIGEIDAALREIERVLKKDGFFQFSITHPCFWDHHNSWSFDYKGKCVAATIRSYSHQGSGKISEWIFDGVKAGANDEIPRFKTAIFKRTFSEWVAALAKVGFYIEELVEPLAPENAVETFPEMEPSAAFPFFAIFRCRPINS